MIAAIHAWFRLHNTEEFKESNVLDTLTFLAFIIALGPVSIFAWDWKEEDINYDK